MDGATLFDELAAAGDRGGGARRHVATSGGDAFRHRGEHGDHLGETLSPDRERRAWPDGRAQTQGDQRRASGLAAADFTLRGLVAELAARGLNR
jgi:hypothetical protein